MRRRNYHTHDSHPPTLAAEVHPRDVPYLPEAEKYVVWSDKLTVGAAGVRTCTAGMQLGNCGLPAVASSSMWQPVGCPPFSWPCKCTPSDQPASLTAACLLLLKPVALGLWQELRVLEGRDDFWRLTVRGGGGHDLLTISPVLQSRAFKRGGSSRSSDATAGVAVAPIGLVNMMNAGGAVLAVELVGEDLWNGTCWMPPGPPGVSRDRRAGWQRQSPSHGLPSLPRIQGECAFLGAPADPLPAEPEVNAAGTAKQSTANGSALAAGPELRILLRGAGRFLLYASRSPAAVLLDGQPIGGMEWEERSGALFFAVPWREPARGERPGGRRAVLVRF